MGAPWSVRHVLALMKVEGYGGSVRPPSWTVGDTSVYTCNVSHNATHTVLDEVEAYTPDDWYFILRHGTEQLLHGNLFVCDFCRRVEDIVVLDINDLCFQACLFRGCAHVKVW